MILIMLILPHCTVNDFFFVKLLEIKPLCHLRDCAGVRVNVWSVSEAYLRESKHKVKACSYNENQVHLGYLLLHSVRHAAQTHKAAAHCSPNPWSR